MMRRTPMIAGQLALGMILVGILNVIPAHAASPAPAWSIRSLALPTNFAPGDERGDVYEVTLTNSGGAASVGSPIAVIADTLPAGLTVSSVEIVIREHAHAGSELCTNGKAGASDTVTCTLPAGFEGITALAPGEGLRLLVHVKTPAGATGTLGNVAQAQGGGAPAVSTNSHNEASSTPAPAGISEFRSVITGVDGLPVSRAGSYPYEFTTSFALNTAFGLERKIAPAEGDVKDVRVALPPGLIGNPTAASRCTAQQFNTRAPGSTAAHSFNECPAGSAVGVIEAFVGVGELYVEPVYNLVPPAGTPAQLGFQVQSAEFYIDTAVRSGSDYGITGYEKEVTEVQRVTAAALTLWGVPADPSHDPLRASCLSAFGFSLGSCTAGVAAKPFLRLPTSCARPMTTLMSFDTWSNPDVLLQESSNGGVPGECGALDFSPTITVRPNSTVADSPTGLHVDLHVPQSDHPGGLAEADLKDAVVTLPAGVIVNPSQANGLVGCPPQGKEGVNLNSSEPGHCPNGSKIGSVEVDTPLLEKPLTGGVYVAQQGNAGPAQGSNPFGSLLAIYVVVEGSGVVVKLAGKVTLDPQTGQLTTTFSENPQLPFEDFKLDFFNGPRAPLVTPSACGTYATTTSLTPWSAPESPAAPSDAFQTSSGCTAGFSPSFTAGTTNNQAGGFSPLSVTVSRGDGEQRVVGVHVQMPPGLLGRIAGIPLCGEAEANAGTCPAASQIGRATAGAGAGTNPVYVPEAGQPPNPVYLTGPYRGAPFGLSIVTHALAGPFDLGNVIVRAAVSIDPHTAQITVTTDPAGPYAIPTILQGIPLDLRTVNVTTDRAGGFMFNPTNCGAMSVSGTITSTAGASVGVSSPFQAANCASLPFKPSFIVSTQGKTNKANGASLDVKIAQKPGEASIHHVDTQLPLALPSRLTTLQKACTETQFAANPAGCPAGSVVGTATAHTPILNAPLTGPAYLVSHGGAAFPDLVILLQGEGIEIEVVGNTDIKKGITFSRFDTVPDAPISTFELNLPQGPHSVLAANGDLCAKSLVMPTTIMGQNGAQVTQSTKISVTGCPPTVNVKKAHVKGNAVLVTVTTTQKATLTISGRGLKTTKKTLGAGTRTITVPLTRVGRAARKGHTKMRIKVSAKNAQGSTSTTTTIRL